MHDALRIKVLTLGEMATNCYVIWSQQSGEGYVIDPADAGDEISQTILAEGIQLQGILLTHGHFDHLLALLELQLNFPAPVYLHPDDQFLLTRANSTAAHFLGRKVDPIPQLTEPLADNQVFLLASASLRVIHTPGHTPGSVCFSVEHLFDSKNAFLFTGDTLFSYGIEPLTHSYSRPIDLNNSLQKLKLLEEKTLILPGHGQSVLLLDALKKAK